MYGTGCRFPAQWKGTTILPEGDNVAIAISQLDIDGDGNVNGLGSDQWGSFTITGRLVGKRFKGDKNYPTYSISWDMTMTPALISGTWSGGAGVG